MNVLVGGQITQNWLLFSVIFLNRDFEFSAPGRSYMPLQLTEPILNNSLSLSIVPIINSLFMKTSDIFIKTQVTN
jgi:hypothetical protein